MQNASLFQFTADVLSPGELPKSANTLRQIIRDQDLSTEKSIEDFFLNELKETPLQTKEATSYYQWISSAAIQYAQEYHRETFFYEVFGLLENRLSALGQAGADVTAWKGYLALAHAAVGRCLRHHSLEVFESAIDELDWGIYDNTFIREISILIGGTYLEEDDKGRRLRARIWLQKAQQESKGVARLGTILRMGRYLYETEDHNQAIALNDLADQAEALEVDASVNKTHTAAVAQLKIMAFHLESLSSEVNSASKGEILNQAQALHESSSDTPSFAAISRMTLLGKAMSQMDTTAAKGLNFAKQAYDKANTAGLEYQAMTAKLASLQIAHDQGASFTEKELKELITYFRKQGDDIAYLGASRLYAEVLVSMDPKHRGKAHDVLMDVMRRGIKRIESGGFYLIATALQLANDLYIPEIVRPGVSWIVETMDEFFELVGQVIESMDEFLPHAGKANLDIFRSEYARMEPASYMNIKVYLRYQFYAAKMMGVSARLMEDEIGARQAEILVKSFSNPANPLNFIRANWDGEFKDVAHDVRNKVVNRCITISKGDLPLAAEHLDDFSYRNLRSYITFNEVHRLGYFMETKTTTNRQLEHAIRLLMHDLYENGTIFEVVFDVPKFLVEHGDGFFAEEMEIAMEIKSTTAKKYINVMVDHKFLIKDKSKGRKHYFYLDRDLVMKRLASDSSTLIDPS